MRCARRTRGVLRLGLWRSVLPVGPSTALAQLSRQFMKRERQATPQTESNVERYFAPGAVRYDKHNMDHCGLLVTFCPSSDVGFWSNKS